MPQRLSKWCSYSYYSWGWVINDNIFFFGWTIPLNYTEIQNKEYSFIENSHNVFFFHGKPTQTILSPKIIGVHVFFFIQPLYVDVLHVLILFIVSYIPSFKLDNDIAPLCGCALFKVFEPSSVKAKELREVQCGAL